MGYGASTYPSSDQLVGMDADHVLVLLIALVLVGAAVSLALTTPSLFGGRPDDVADASLASFETSEPYCGDPDRTTGSSVSHDVTGGEAIVINKTIPVATNDTAVNATLAEFGPQRYILEVTRETPNGTTAPSTADSAATVANGSTAQECHPQVGYNASIHVGQPDEYTVLVTYDDELVSAYWREGSDGGSYGRIPDPVETTTPGNRTETADGRGTTVANRTTTAGNGTTTVDDRATTVANRTSAPENATATDSNGLADPPDVRW